MTHPHDTAWQASTDIGYAFEARVAEKLRRTQGVSLLRYERGNTRKGYDMSFIKDNIFKTVECKCDRMAERTRNFFIQTEKDGRPHGLMTTTASYWFISIERPETGPILVVRPVDLLKHLSDLIRLGAVKKVTKAGRSVNTTGYLMPLQALMQCQGLQTWE